MASSICFHCILYSNFLFFHFFLMELHIKEIWSSSLHFSLPSGKYKILAFSKATHWKTRVCCRFRNKVFLQFSTKYDQWVEFKKMFDESGSTFLQDFFYTYEKGVFKERNKLSRVVYIPSDFKSSLSQFISQQ